MGLDTSIILGLRKKSMATPFVEVFIAYWRKYYGLTRTLLFTAREEDKWRAQEDTFICGRNPWEEETCSDYLTTCNSSVLTSWIEEITTLLRDKEADEWSDSIWEDVRARGYTARQLENILIAESICSMSINEYALELYKELYDEETREWFPRGRKELFEETTIKEILEHPDDYVWDVIFENSY